MVKQRSDEPDDKALERLREFEQKRMPVAGEDKDEKKEDKNPPKNTNEKKPGKQDKATDEL